MLQIKHRLFVLPQVHGVRPPVSRDLGRRELVRNLPVDDQKAIPWSIKENKAGMNPPSILVVDDDRNFLRVLEYHVQEFGFRSQPASSGADALKLLEEKETDLVITDLKMPGMDGFELLEEIQRRHPDIPVIVLTAHGTIDKEVEAVTRGAAGFLAKPFEKEEVKRAILKALRMSELPQKNRRLAQEGRRESDGLTANSKA
jgi:DNA-binding NtrC family response regulator